MNKIAGRSASLLSTCSFYFFWNPVMTLGSVHLVMLIEQNRWKNKDNSKEKINTPLIVPDYKPCRYLICLFFGGVALFQFWISSMVPSRKTKAIFCFKISYNRVAWSKSRFLKANAYFRKNFKCLLTWLSSSFILHKHWYPRSVPILCWVSRALHWTC